MSTLLQPALSHSRAPLPEDWPTGILVATDGRPPAEAALTAASRLAGHDQFGVISVLPSGFSTDRATRWDAEPPTPETQRELVASQLHRVLGGSVDPRIELRRGYPPAVIAAYAATHGTALLVVGLGQPRVLDRLRGDESTLRLSRMVQTPTFAVASNCAVPPRRVVVALDLNPPSIRAARLALALSAPMATVILVNVKSPTSRMASAGALERHADALRLGFSGRVETAELEGDAATELLAFANAQSADAIALGTHGDHVSVSGAMGPVATRVIRCATCSLLVAPGTH